MKVLWLHLPLYIAFEWQLVHVSAGYLYIGDTRTPGAAIRQLGVQPLTNGRSRSRSPTHLFFSDSTEPSHEDLERVPSNMPDAIDRFFLGPDRGPIAIVGILAGFLGWRFSMESLVGVLDIATFTASVVFWWIQEHVMHQKLLHSDFDWIGKDIHQGHHELPYFHISIDPAPLMLGWLAVAHIILRLTLPFDLAISASIGYAAAGLVYEWAHYVAHTRVKPPNAYWKSVRDNHIKHHMVDNRYWFTFSVPVIDKWFGTSPPLEKVRRSSKSSVIEIQKG